MNIKIRNNKEPRANGWCRVIKTRDCFVKAVSFTRRDNEEELTPLCFLSGPEINRRAADIASSIDSSLFSHFGNRMHSKQGRRAIGINFVGTSAGLCRRRRYSLGGFARESSPCIKTEIDASASEINCQPTLGCFVCSNIPHAKCNASVVSLKSRKLFFV